MRRQSIQRLMAVLFLAGMAVSSSAQLLKGRVIGATVEDGLVTYSADGNIYHNQMTEFSVGADGLFSYDTKLTGDTGDVTVEMDGIGYFGVHLVKGQTVEMTVEKQGDEWGATFKGAETDVSRFYNIYTQAMDPMKYWSPDPSEAKTNAEYRRLLSSNYSKVKAALPMIKDKQQRDYYKRLAESQNKWLTIRLIMDNCEDTKSDYQDDAEFKQLVKDIDVNDPINVQTNMAYTALSSLAKSKMEGDNGAYCEEMMVLCDQKVTNPALRSFLVSMIGQVYFTYGNGEGDYEAFTKKYVAWAGDQKEEALAMANQFIEKRQSMENTKQGKEAPDVTLTTPTGEKMQLRDVARGKFTYIDVWATWCGPCVKEIPHLEKLVEKFKDNDKVQFLSISIDANEAAWHKKLEKDNPQWPQFIINGETEKQFSADWGITGIPRFIMINADGTIYSGDATRPSEEQTEQTIIEQTK